MGERSTGYINEHGVNVGQQIHSLIETARVNTINNDPLLDLAGLQHPNTTHPLLEQFVSDPDVISRVSEVRDALSTAGTIGIKISTLPVIFDGQKVPLSFVTATGTEATSESDNMSDGVWIRDQAFIAQALLQEADPNLQDQGQALLLSLLYSMSTPSQIERFDNVIRAKGDIIPDDHPSIKFQLEQHEDDILLDHNTKWGHNQDAWQILGCIAFEAYENGKIDTEQLKQYGEFFRRIPTFLSEINYLQKESKGSWEEISANGRLSTIVWEWALLTRLFKHADVLDLDVEVRANMHQLIEAGAETIIRQFPQEAPEDGLAHRDADVALLYIGLAQAPELLRQLEEYGCKPANFAANPLIQEKIAAGLDPVDAMYRVMFDTVETLKDEATGGYARYLGDSYQASGFYSPNCWEALTNEETGLWKDSQYRDSKGVIHFGARAELLNALNQKTHGANYGDNIARWMHPNTQAASIAFRRARETTNPAMSLWYERHGTRDFQDALRMITGETEYTLAPGANGIEVRLMKSGIAPECYMTQVLPAGETVSHPGPWGPLFWAAAGLRQMLLEAENYHTWKTIESSGYDNAVI